MNKAGIRPGFSLIEVIVALMILSVGVLAMGASTGHIMSQIRASEFRTQRMVAVRQAVETLRATTWAALETECGSTEFHVGRYYVNCSVTQPANSVKRVQIVSDGPGYRGGRLVTSVVDTFAISIAQPLP